MLVCINATPIWHYCIGGNYTTNSTKYLANLDLLLSSLPSKTTTSTGFYNTTVGENDSDKSYGLFLCRGDVTQEDCHNCVEMATNEIKPLCPNTTTTIAWYDYCMIRYSNQSIFSIMEENPEYCIWNGANVSNPDQFNETVADLMNGLLQQVTYSSGTRKYAADEKSFANFQKVYGLVECTPDISQDDCYTCLSDSIGQIPSCCYPKLGAQIHKPSCNMRFEFNNLFYRLQNTSQAPSSSTTPSSTTTINTDGKKSNTNIIVFVVINVAAIITTMTISILYLRFRRKQKLRLEDDDVQSEITSADSLLFNFDTIRDATNNFSDANKLGQGGFGAVYKGKLLDGKIVAVKRLSRNSGQGEIEFKNEVLILAKLQHRNLVRLLGFSLKGEEKLLVYEFVPNKSLDYFIYDPIQRSQLDWEERYKIIEGIARGLLYLHEDSRLKIIHRDLKASNILLDDEMNPKIADFGLARLFVVDQTQTKTSRIVGTHGYMAPEYMMRGHVSVKTDVFSFGVLILEIVSGQRNNDFDPSGSIEGLLSSAWRNWIEGTVTALIDPTLRENCPRSEVIRCIHIGLLCAQENVSNRLTIATVNNMLNRCSATLPLPSSPGAFAMDSEVELANDSRVKESSGQSTSISAKKSINKMSITELSAR
ncbi:hypothetical protein NE237_001532 [Protea cynaroides]|uniref:Uncharacterized protein n=1 Tax=Protea cynaroides TaxID=273540 RepID=A0A9Q0KU59_9MAGN|nr:hypothetical protein NE237_001532 [Protea cynaroides]